MRRITALALGSFMLASCSNEVSGPSPSLADSNEATDPSYACNEELETWVTLSGSDFSPLVIDALAKDEPTNVNLPDVALTLSASPEGGAADGEFATTLTDEGENLDVRWFNGSEMRFRVYEELGLQPGVYDITVTNANGETATQPAAFGVIPRPVVTDLVPSYLCLAENTREVEVRGDWFVVDGDNPTVTVGGEEYAPTSTADCRDLASVFGGATACESLTIEIPVDAYEPGVEDVTVTNPAPAACTSNIEEDGSTLRVVAPPSIDQIEEELACVAQGERSFVITGAGLISTGELDPVVTIDGQTYPATLDGCETVEVFNGSFENCTSASFTVPDGDLSAGVYGVAVENPMPAGCSSSELVELTITPPPSIDTVAPEVLCTEQLENQVTITGSDFIVVDGTAPTVTVGTEDFDSVASNCEDVPSVTRSTVENCSTLTVTIPADTLVPGEQNVTVTNPDPAGCESTDSVSVAFVPPPEVTAIVEDFTCVETRTDTATIEGNGFLTVGMENPTVTIGGVEATVLSIDGCMSIMGATTAESCSEIEVEIAEGSLGVGLQDVVVTNPAPAACVSEEMIQLETYAAPAVSGVQPGFFCTDSGDTGVTLTGTGFLEIDGTSPSVVIAGQTFQGLVTQTECTMTSRMNVQSCTELTATIPQGSVTGGSAAVGVINPEPAACPSSTDGDALVGGPPTIASAMPGAVCAGTTFDGNVTLTGDNFLTIDGNLPSVTVDGVVVTPTLSNCSPIPDANLTIQSCTDLALVVPVAQRNLNSIPIEVTNPAPSDCGGAATFTLQTAPTPQVTAVTPLRLCDQGGTIQIDGTNFEQGMTVTLDGTAADMVTVNMAGTQATATFAAGIPVGEYTLIVENPNTCSDTHDEDIRVVTGPRPFFVDPPVVYDGISTRVTIFLTGLFGGSVTGAEIIDSMGNVTPLVDLTFNALEPNTVQAVIPAGTLPMGTTTDSYDVRLIDDLDCAETTQDLVDITSELTVSIESIDPPFGWTQSDNAVTVTSADPPPAGEDNFAAVPRVYLNPANPMMGDIATEIQAIEFFSATELSGIVPAGLPADTTTGATSYDVIVINPDGSVGLLPAAYDSTVEPPPLVDSVSPGSWETNDAMWAITVEGSDFRMPQVDVTCTAPDGTVDTRTATVTSSDPALINATVDTNGLDGLSVCVLRVTNTDNNTYADFAPITITNPAGNFVSFISGNSLNTSRRSHMMAGGSATRTAKFLYAIGGDDGSGTKLSSIERAPLDSLGRPAGWTTTRSQLPAGLSNAGVTALGDFIYLSGGTDGTNTSADVWRARVLDPLDSPDITNVEFDIDPMLMGGLTPGVYYYRVAAVFGGSNTQNPGGETLASERQPVRIPFQGVTLTLDWAPFANASEYRVYRTPMADMNAGEEELIATIPAGTTQFIDDGTSTTTVGETPLPIGALGEWHSVATLATPRSFTQLAAAEDPDTPGIWYLYTIGGTDSTDTISGVTEYLTVTVDPATGDQTAGAMSTATATLATPRTEHNVVVGTSENASLLTGSVLYVLGGKQAVGPISRDTDYAAVPAGGDIVAWTSTTSGQRSRAGYASAMANNNIVNIGGQNGAPSGSADKQSVDPINAPALGTSSALGNTGMFGDRYLHGFTSFNGYLYVTGGQTAANAADSSTAYSILGGTP